MHLIPPSYSPRTVQLVENVGKVHLQAQKPFKTKNWHLKRQCTYGMSWVKSAQKLQTTDKGMVEVIKALAQAAVTQQQATVTQQQALAEANRRHEEAMAQQQENTRLLVAQFTAQQESSQAQVAALQEAVQRLVQGREQAVVAASNPVRASHFLTNCISSCICDLGGLSGLYRQRCTL